MKTIENIFEQFFNSSKDLSLNAMKYFMNEYNNFEKDMKFIHIAGTNGKGSCTEMITNILISQGFKVGKFISPHLIRYNERIQINNKKITNKKIIDLYEELKPKISSYEMKFNKNITFFELITIMALIYFYKNDVDFVVLETGLGGLYDCTNIITKPLISIITSIGLDHVKILGNTLSKITYQKAGIIKENSNTIFFEQSKDINNIISNECKRKNNRLYLLNSKSLKNYKYDEKFQYFDYKTIKNIKVNLKGKVQIKNAIISIECANILNNLGYKITTENIKKGLATIVHKGRFEILTKNPLIIYDGAHNEQAIGNFIENVNMYYKNYRKNYVISILKTKEYKKIIELLLQDQKASFTFTTGNDEKRYVPKEELYNIAKKIKNDNQEIYSKNLNEAIKNIKEKNKEVNFIVGSFYIYKDVLKMIK